jgi:hypothetical protein
MVVMPKKRPDPAASRLGKKSAKARLGGLSKAERSEAMRALVKRRWEKRAR